MSSVNGILTPNNYDIFCNRLETEVLRTDELLVGPFQPLKGTTLVGDGTTYAPLIVGTDGHVLTADSGTPEGVRWAPGGGGGGGGDVSGPASSTDNAIARYDGATGKIIQNSTVTIDDTGAMFVPTLGQPAFSIGVVGAFDTSGRLISLGSREAVWQLGADNVTFVKIGSGTVCGPEQIAIGEGAVHNDTTTVGDIAIGDASNTSTNGSGKIAIGAASQSNGDECVSLGQASESTGDEALSLGTRARALGTRSIAVGGRALASNPDNISVGHAADSSLGGIALGSSATTTATHRLSINDQGTTATGGGSATLSQWHNIRINETDYFQPLFTSTGALGTGDVVGPASALNNRLAAFDGTTGKLIKDSGVLISSLGDVDGPGSATNNHIATFNGASGKIIKDSGVTISDLDWQTQADALSLVRVGSTATAASAGQVALLGTTTGANSVSIGPSTQATNTSSVAIGLSSVASGVSSVAIGASADATNTSAVAIGTNAQGTASDTVGVGNNSRAEALGGVAVGSLAAANTLEQVAVGFNVLGSNTTGTENTGVGGRVLTANTIGQDNTGIGWRCLIANTEGNNNSAVGSGSLFSVTTGDNNTGVGFSALDTVITGNNNTVVGSNSDVAGTNTSSACVLGASAISSSSGVAVGFSADAGAGAVAVGQNSQGVGTDSVAIGGDAVTSGTDAIAIGRDSSASQNHISIGPDVTDGPAFILSDRVTSVPGARIVNRSTITTNTSGALALYRWDATRVGEMMIGDIYVTAYDAVSDDYKSWKISDISGVRISSTTTIQGVGGSLVVVADSSTAVTANWVVTGAFLSTNFISITVNSTGAANPVSWNVTAQWYAMNTRV